MPELPEVETLCRQLRDSIKGKRIAKTEIFDSKLAGREEICGRIIRDVQRSGKTIELMLEDGRIVAIHLRMTGRLFWNPRPERLPHTRWRMTVAGGHIDLVDPRRFGTVQIKKGPRSEAANDLMQKFDERAFLENQAGRKVPVKVLLMDPKAIAGIGNIYACEILHRAGISPTCPASDIDKARWKDIFRHGKRILKKGIEMRGTSISDWRDLYGRPGENQHELKAYGREGKTCSICGGVIKRIKQAGRSTFYCPDCQK